MSSSSTLPATAPAGLLTRQLAHRLLTGILRHGQNFGDAVNETPQLNGLAERDRAFTACWCCSRCAAWGKLMRCCRNS
jgi:hypothetical protein